MNTDIAQLTSEKVDSVLYQVDYAHYQTFDDLLKYLESAETVLDSKVDKISEKMEIVQEEFVRNSTLFQMNNKKRQNKEELLRLQRERIAKELDQHRDRLSDFELSTITPILKQKKTELQKLEQTKQIVEEFGKLLKGSEEDLKNLMPLDPKHFSKSALKIYVFKVLLEDIHGREYDQAKLEISKKYSELQQKIIQNFKEGFRNKDTKTIRNTLPYCEEYELLDEISEFYNEQIFKSVNKVTRLSSQLPKTGDEEAYLEQLSEGESEIKNMFFLIQKCFQTAFNHKDETTGEINSYQINTIMGQYAESFGRKLITFAFDKIIKESLENVLKASMNYTGASKKMTETANYLAYLEIFYDESKKLVKNTEKIITDDRIVHLMSTYFQSIFDTYLDSYLSKQLSNLSEMYQYCTQDIMKDISETAISGATQYARDKEKAFSASKKTIKQLLYDFTIQSKKNLMNEPSNQTPHQAPPEGNNKIKNLLSLFMNPSLETLFSSTKKSLARNNKIAKINEVDRNRNEILQAFISNMEQIIQNLISLVSEIVPPFDERAPPLDPQFFQIIPNINLLLQRIEIMYEEYKRENKYRLTEAIKLDQKKENLINVCGNSLNKVVGEAMATILSGENAILLQDQNQYFVTNGNFAQTSDVCGRVITFLQKYIRAIQRISLINYRNNILRNLGLQFVTLLIKFYSQIPYNKEGLSKIFMDVAKLKTAIAQFGCEQVEIKFKVLRSLIDIYVIKNEEKAIEDYVRAEDLLQRTQKEATIHTYIKNKMLCERK